MTHSDLKKMPPALRDSVRLVERTRGERLARLRRGEGVARLSLSDRKAWLSEYHPDYAPEGVRPLQLGVSAGEMVPGELADLLESWPRSFVSGLRAGDWALTPDMETDVLILGGGGAGMTAAIAAAEKGVQVVVATKLRPGDSNTIMAEGGIQVADQECDTPMDHYIDTMGGGHFKNDPELVEALVCDGPGVLSWLESLGMLLDKYPTGRMVVRHGGGTFRKRLHSAGDVTGLEMMRVLKDHAETFPNIRFLPFLPAVELLTDENGRAVGAVLESLTHPGSGMIVKAKAVVMATGGFGRLHLNGFPTSNHYGATADGLAMAYRAGLPLTGLRFSQYHPTGIVFPEQQLGLLATEKFRGMGAQLVNRHGDEFVFGLEPRDVTTAAIIRECREFENGVRTPGGGVGVWLDIPMIDILHGLGTIEREFPGRFHDFWRSGIDIRKDPLLTYPTLHYQNGGVAFGKDGGTDMPGLFAAGEVTGGVHGNNRLMGNALLEIIVFGRRAGDGAAQFAASVGAGSGPTLSHLDPFEEALQEYSVPRERISPRLLPSYGATKPV